MTDWKCKWPEKYFYFSILVWSNDQDNFVVCRQYSTQEPCSCFLFTPYSLIVGAERFYKIDLKNFTIEGTILLTRSMGTWLSFIFRIFGRFWRFLIIRHRRVSPFAIIPGGHHSSKSNQIATVNYFVSASFSSSLIMLCFPSLNIKVVSCIYGWKSVMATIFHAISFRRSWLLTLGTIFNLLQGLK